MREAALRIARFGAAAVLIKGGHSKVRILRPRPWTSSTMRASSPNSAPAESKPATPTGRDVLIRRPSRRLLARGLPMLDAVARAKRFIDEAIRTNPGLGGGSGPGESLGDGDSL